MKENKFIAENADAIVLSPIAYIESPYDEKFGIPRQSSLVNNIESRIIFRNKFRNPDIIRGLNGFSHIWLLWGFSETAGKWSPTVRPPRLGGNKRVGVFATRSPFRPNPIGLSSVTITNIIIDKNLGPVIYVAGADLMNGTPIYDIKPYITNDCHSQAIHGFQDKTKDYKLNVNFPENMLKKLPDSLKDGAVEIISNDPRPSYHNDENRIYTFSLGNNQISFKVKNNTAEVISVKKDCSIKF